MDCNQKELLEYFTQRCKFVKEFHAIKDEIINNEILLNSYKKDVDTIHDSSQFMNSYKNYCEEEKKLNHEIKLKKQIIDNILKENEIKKEVNHQQNVLLHTINDKKTKIKLRNLIGMNISHKYINDKHCIIMKNNQFRIIFAINLFINKYEIYMIEPQLDNFVELKKEFEKTNDVLSLLYVLREYFK